MSRKFLECSLDSMDCQLCLLVLLPLLPLVSLGVCVVPVAPGQLASHSLGSEFSVWLFELLMGR